MIAKGRGSCERAKGGVKECEGRRRWLDRVEATSKSRSRIKLRSRSLRLHQKRGSSGDSWTEAPQEVYARASQSRQEDDRRCSIAPCDTERRRNRRRGRPPAPPITRRPRSRGEGARAAAARGASGPPALAIPSPSKAVRTRFRASSSAPYLHTSPRLALRSCALLLVLLALVVAPAVRHRRRLCVDGAELPAELGVVEEGAQVEAVVVCGERGGCRSARGSRRGLQREREREARAHQESTPQRGSSA